MAEPSRRNSRRQTDVDARSKHHTNSVSPNKQVECSHNRNLERTHIRADVSILEQKKWTRTDVIACLALAVSAILAIFTYNLYRIAANDSKTASNAAKIAQRTLDATRSYDSVSLIKQQAPLLPQAIFAAASPATASVFRCR